MSIFFEKIYICKYCTKLKKQCLKCHMVIRDFSEAFACQKVEGFQNFHLAFWHLLLLLSKSILFSSLRIVLKTATKKAMRQKRETEQCPKAGVCCCCYAELVQSLKLHKVFLSSACFQLDGEDESFSTAVWHTRTKSTWSMFSWFHVCLFVSMDAFL